MTQRVKLTYISLFILLPVCIVLGTSFGAFKIEFKQCTNIFLNLFGAETNQFRKYIFTDQSSPGKGGTIVSYHWEFGDGVSSSLPNPSHTYQYGGQKKVRLIISTNNNYIDTAYQYVQVPNDIVKEEKECKAEFS
jgi:hypothetical protein